jgi:hypothetical protein
MSANKSSAEQAHRLTLQAASHPVPVMAQILDFTIVTYERAPGHWRAAFTPKRAFSSQSARSTVHSIVTADCDTEADAQSAAEQAIKLTE